MSTHDIFHMASFSRSGETLMQRCLNGHPDLEVVLQLMQEEPPEDRALFDHLQTHPDTTIAATHPLLAHRALPAGRALLLKNAVWTHRHPRAGFILIRNPFSLVKSAFRDAPEDAAQIGRQKNQQRRWATQIDPLMREHAGQDPTIAGFAALYARKMLHDRRSGLPFVRYEDFILDPERWLRAILAHLGLPWHDGVLTSHEAYAPGARGHGGIKLWEPINTGSETKYKAMSDAAKSTTYSLTHAVLDAYGYTWDGADLGLKDTVDGML